MTARTPSKWDDAAKSPYSKFALFDDNDGSKVICLACKDHSTKGAHIIKMRAPFQIYAFKQHTQAHYHKVALHAFENKDKNKKNKQSSLLAFGVTKTTEKSNSDPARQILAQRKPPSIPKKAKLSCEGVIPFPNQFQDQLVYTFNYVNLNNLGFDIRPLGINSMLRIYSKQCNDNAQPAKQGHVACCSECLTFRREKWKNVKDDVVKKNHANFSGALDALSKTTPTQVDMQALLKIKSINDQFLSDEGKQFKVRCQAHWHFANKMMKIIPKDKIVDVVGEDRPGVTSSPNKFLESFASLLQKHDQNPAMERPLCLLAVEAMIARDSGHKNSPLHPRLAQFYVALQALSPAASRFVRANFPSPHIRTLQRQNKKVGDQSMIIDCDKKSLLDRFDNQMKVFAEAGMKHINLSVSIDATALSPVTELCTKSGCILGFASPDHKIEIPTNASQDQIKDLLMPSAETMKKRELAVEVKVAVVAVQDAPPGTNSFFPLCALPQTKNVVSTFNDDLMQWLSEHSKSSSQNFTLLSAAVDGVSCDKEFVVSNLLKFLQAKQDYLSITDPNHNIKNFRYQVIGGSGIRSIGKFVVDADLVRVAGIKMELWRIKDFASDGLVLELASAKTVTSLCSLESKEDGKTIVTLCLILFFMRLHLFAVNGTTLPARKRVYFLWSSMLFLTSVRKVSMTTKRNLVASTVGLIFLIMRKGVNKPRLLTSEPGEHLFGILRTMQREFTVMGFNNNCKRLERKIQAVAAGNLKVSRDKQSGYSATTDDYLKSVQQAEANGGIVEIDQRTAELEGFSATKIWTNGVLCDQLASATKKMTEFLKEQMGVTKEELSLFFFIDFADKGEGGLRDFAEEVANFLGKKLAEDEPDDYEDDDNSTMEGKSCSEANFLSSAQKSMILECVEVANKLSDTGNDTTTLEFTELADDDDDLDSAMASQQEMNDESLKDDVATKLLVKVLGVMGTSKDNFIEAALQNITVGMELMEMKEREKGSTSATLKFKSLSQRYFTLGKSEKITTLEGSSTTTTEKSIIERDVVVSVKVDKKSQLDFVIMGVFNKHSNKWHLMPQDNKDALQTNGVRFHGRRVKFEAATGLYSLVEHDNGMDPLSIWKQFGVSDIVEVKGKLNYVDN